MKCLECGIKEAMDRDNICSDCWHEIYLGDMDDYIEEMNSCNCQRPSYYHEPTGKFLRPFIFRNPYLYVRQDLRGRNRKKKQEINEQADMLAER